MYRHDRIGPWPLSNLQAAPIPFGQGDVTGGPMPALNCYVPSAVANLEHASETLYSLGGLTVAAGSGFAVGVKISGQKVFNGIQYLIALGGQCSLSTPDTDSMLVPFVGRVSDNGEQVPIVKDWTLLPHEMWGAGGAGNQLTSSVNVQAVMGDWTPSINPEDENELVFGWWVQNWGADPGTYDAMYLSASIHRYETDLKTYDPNR